MIGLDTHVVVRCLAPDDPGQSALAAAAIDGLSEQDPGLLSMLTVVELHWVLRRAYRVSAAECGDPIEGLLDSRELRVDQASTVRAALRQSRDGVDLADALIAELGRVARCEHTVTLDRRAARSKGMQLLIRP